MNSFILCADFNYNPLDNIAVAYYEADIHTKDIGTHLSLIRHINGLDRFLVENSGFLIGVPESQEVGIQHWNYMRRIEDLFKSRECYVAIDCSLNGNSGIKSRVGIEFQRKILSIKDFEKFYDFFSEYLNQALCVDIMSHPDFADSYFFVYKNMEIACSSAEEILENIIQKTN